MTRSGHDSGNADRRDTGQTASAAHGDDARRRPYRGRFAPTPSGPLHFGSLVAAVGSFLDARAHCGEWRLRIDDLDAPRVQPGATASIQRCLEQHGLLWDGAVIHQSRRIDAYHAALHRLRRHAAIYPCACSRTEIAVRARAGLEGPVYPGTCRTGLAAGVRARAWRLRCAGARVTMQDRILGTCSLDLDSTLGDYVLYRSDGVYAFHLASAVDDADFGVTDIVRGADLLLSSMRQIHLTQLLGAPPVRHAHLPIARDAAGEKLSKQTHAPALDESRPSESLLQALTFLGQSPPAALARAPLATVWQWAHEHWQLQRVPRDDQRGVGPA